MNQLDFEVKRSTGHGHDEAKYGRKVSSGIFKVRHFNIAVTDNLSGESILVDGLASWFLGFSQFSLAFSIHFVSRRTAVAETLKKSYLLEDINKKTRDVHE